MMTIVVLLFVGSAKTVKAQINNNDEDALAQTAYVDMSYVSPLQLHFTEADSEQKPDYYYAAQAYNILRERIEMDAMYRSCKEVIVTINKAFTTQQIIKTTCEPQVQTGYLNLLSKESNKYYTIDDIVIRIQRENES